MKFLIMHGSYGSPDENWFRWLEKELKVLNNEVILQQFPVDEWGEVEKVGRDNIDTYQAKESLDTWEKYFAEHILTRIGNEPIGFVGHSIAPIFMLHMLERYDIKLKVAVFVSPFFSIPDRAEIWQFYPVNKTFYSYSLDFEKINKKIDKSYVVYGDNDPYVPSTEPPLFAEKLGSEIHIVPQGRHCGSNFQEFPLLMDIIKPKV